MDAYFLKCWRRALVGFGVAVSAVSSQGAADTQPSEQSLPPAALAGSLAPQQVPNLKLLPPIEEIATPSEQAILSAFLVKVAQVGSDNNAVITAADDALSRVLQPTKLRGFIQYVKAKALSDLSRDIEAIDPVEESVRLLPGYSGPLFLASNIYAYADRPKPAASYLFRAIATDPATARTIDEYDVGNLIHRLDAIGDRRTAGAVGERLLNIGWSGRSLDTGSRLAQKAIELRVTEGNTPGAQVLVPKLLAPGDTRVILMNKAYAPVWPAVEQWAGPKLERQWPIYLREAHDRWASNKSAETTHDYVRALLGAGYYRTVVRDALPLFDKPNKDDDYELIFSVYSVAKALAHLGRWNDADQLFVRALRIWLLGQDANALNIAANYAQFLLIQNKPAEALSRMDAAIQDARKWGPEVNFDAISAMYHYRACMLHELHRDSEAGLSAAVAMKTRYGDTLAELYLCLGDFRSAKAVMLKSLQEPSNRDTIVAFMQPDSEPLLDSAYDRKMRTAEDALRGDPELLNAMSKFGRILDFKFSDGAPPEAP